MSFYAEVCGLAHQWNIQKYTESEGMFHSSEVPGKKRIKTMKYDTEQ